MDLAEMRSYLDEQLGQMDARNVPAKDAQRTVLEMSDLWSQLTEQERELADDVVIEWLDASESKRFIAMSVIHDFSITRAIPALRVLAEQFEQATGPSAPYDWAKANRLLGYLAECSRGKGQQ